MRARWTRVLLPTALLCCCVAALAVAGIASEPSPARPDRSTQDTATPPVLIASSTFQNTGSTSGWQQAPQAAQAGVELGRKPVYQFVPITESPEVEAKSLELGEKPDVVARAEEVAPMAVDSAAQGLLPEAEPNGTAATATPLGGTDLVAIGTVFPAADVDYWSFLGSAGDRVYAAIQNSGSAGSSTDSELRLLASDGVTVIEFDQDDGSLGSTASTIANAVLPAAGVYYLQVKNFSATTTTRPYHLHFRLQSGGPTAEAEPNDTPATANALPANGWVSGARNPAAATEQDWFSFTAAAGDTVFLSLDLDPERDNVQWNGRLGIALFGDAGNQILVIDDTSTGTATNPLSEALFMTVKNAGTYYAFVDAALATVGGPTATYTLSVSIHPATEIGVSCATYSSGTVNLAIGPGAGTTDSIIAVPGSPRIADANVSIVASHALIGDMDVALLSPAGNENSLFTDLAPTATGGQTMMDIDLDDEAGIPPVFGVHRGLGWQTEANSRLGWFKGENGGGNWTLRIRDDLTNASGGTLVSWSLTICEPPPPPVCAGTPVTVYTSDFEADDGGFTHSASAGTDNWARGTPTAVPITTCNSGVNCWKTNLTGDYSASSNMDLVSPTLSLSGLEAPIEVTWAQRYQMETRNFDAMSAEVREPGPTNVTTLFQWLDGTMRDTVGSPTVTLQETAGWGLVRRSIDGYADQTIQLRWNVTTDSSVNLAGLAIDDVTVTACCTPQSCDDGNPCTDDSCSASGCSNVPNTDPCDDGSLCTSNDACLNGTCTGTPTNCDDSDACTTDGCDAGTGLCTHDPLDCDDSNPCTNDSCDTVLGCQYVNNTDPCTDGNVCTSGDVCSGGTCAGTDNTDPCTDGDPCTLGDVCSGGTCVPGPAPAVVSYCNMDGITINDSAALPTLATPYPSAIPVAGGPYLCSARVRLNGYSHTFPDDVDLLLAAPAGQNAIIMSDAGGSADAVGLTLVLDDAAATALSDAGPLVSGTFKPANYAPADTFPAPAPAPLGGSALSVFTGTNPNGTWNLYVDDDASGDSGSFGSWCLELATICSVDADCDDSNACTDDACVAGSCTFTPNTDPCDDGSLCTSNDACSGGTCTGTPTNCDDSNACTIDGCDAGTGLCTHDPVDCDDVDPCTVDFCDTQTGCGHIDQCVEFCNNDGITINDSATPPTTATLYPSTIAVSGVTGTFSLAAVKINGITHTFPDDIDALLTGPTGADAILLSDVGGGGDITGVNLVLSDAAAASIPDGGPIVSGTFKPSNVNPGTGTEDWPAPAPAPSGGSVLSAFTGTDPNGNWDLFVVDDQNGDAGSVTAWCLEVLATCVGNVDCDDADPCTSDTCVNSLCQNAPIGSPGEVTGVTFAGDKQTISWNPEAVATLYDAVRGDVSALPVGPGGGDEVCFADIAGTSTVDAAVPGVGTGYWYVVRGENACAAPGGYGNATAGPRVTTTCP